MGGKETDVEKLTALLPKVDNILLGSSIISIFVMADARMPSGRLLNQETIETINALGVGNVNQAENFLIKANSKGVRVLIPTHVITQTTDGNEEVMESLLAVLRRHDVKDIAAPALTRFEEIISKSNTIMWMGSLGGTGFEDGNNQLGHLIQTEALKYTMKKIIVAGPRCEAAVLKAGGVLENIHFTSNFSIAVQILLGKSITGVQLLDKIISN